MNALTTKPFGGYKAWLGIFSSNILFVALSIRADLLFSFSAKKLGLSEHFFFLIYFVCVYKSNANEMDGANLCK